MTTMQIRTALQRRPVGEVILQFGQGWLAFDEQLVDEQRCWQWLATVLDHLVTQLPAGATVDDLDTLDVIGFTAHLCRSAAAGAMPASLFWQEALDATDAAAQANRAACRWQGYWALEAASDAATAGLDHHLDPAGVQGLECLVSAFTSLAASADDETVRKALIEGLIDEWERLAASAPTPPAAPQFATPVCTAHPSFRRAPAAPTVTRGIDR